MEWQRALYMLPLLVPVGISSVSAIYIWRHRHRSPVAKPLVLILVAGTSGLSSYALRLIITNFPIEVFLLKTEYIQLAIIPVAWFVLVLQYTRREKWVTRRNLMVLSVVPITTLLLTFTNTYHGLMYSEIVSIEVGELSLLRPTHGSWFWVHVTYSEILALSGSFLLIHMFIRARRLYRRQITSLVLASSLMQLWGVLPSSKMSPLSYVSVTVLLFSVVGPLVALSIFRFRVADIVPVARSTILDGMSDGVMVMDSQNRILDVNSLVQQLVGRSSSEVIGKSVEEVCPGWLDQTDSRNETQTGKEIVVNLEEQRIYDVRTSSLTDWRGNLVSQIVVLHDITDRKKAEMQLRNIFEASKLINSTMDINEIFKFISDSCQTLAGFDHFTIFLVSKDKKHIYPAFTAGNIGNKTGRSVLEYGEGLVGHCIATRETVLLGNAHKNERAKKIYSVTEPFMSHVVVPLVIENECVGALHISNAVENAYNQKDVDVLKPLSEVVSSAIRNSNLYNEIKRFGEEQEKKIKDRSKRIEILLNARQELQKETSWERGLSTIVESMKMLGFDGAGAFLVDLKGEKLIFHLGKGDDLPEAGASISLKRKEYFGVKCVLEKKTIHAEDSTSVEGKQLVESNSFVWVPIVVQDEAFAALAAFTTKSKRITDEDVKDLEILAGMCAAFIDRTRIQIEPVVEKALKTEIKHQLNPREGFLVLEKKPEKSFEIFVDLVTHGISGFVVSREHPEKVKEKYKLLKTPMLWLSRTETKDAINPDDLPKLSYIIDDFTRKSTESVILLDGLEYLIIHTGFETVLKYLHELRDIITLNNSRLIMPVNKETLSSKESNMLEREFTIVEHFTI